ncbi:hypothetical protein [Proteiniphilum sp. UBA5259]|jgi:hypothetical protein|uniref:hypothetical protein n=1 Tax=Proteiniphilum sp. UBA5259 TaxID=1947269 RepID=UPI00257CCB37|nr:hypothetical protein [Proteiniphilum sp. UBA5259]
MRKTLVILITTFFISCAGSKQSVGIEDFSAPLNTNVIFVNTKTDADSTFKNIGRLLLDRGYSFRFLDDDFKTISTEFRGVSQRWGVDNTFVRLSVSVQDDSNSRVVIKGWYKTLENEDSETGQTIKKFGQNGSPARDAWIEMYQFASSLGGTLEFQNI